MLNIFDKNRRFYPIPFVPVQLSLPDKSTIDGQRTRAGRKDGWESLDGVKEPIIRTKSWPDGGINMPSAKVLDSTVEDDQNDWGGLPDLLNQLAEKKIGPGNYPDEPDFCYNMLTEDKLKYTWIIPGLLAAGAHPVFTLHQNDLSEFEKAGFRAIVSVFDKPLDPKYIEGFHYHFAPTAKGSSNGLDAICKFIDTQESLNNPVLVHSFDGKGRAAAVLAAYLYHMNYLTAEESINYVKQYYKSAMTPTQEEAILKFAESN